MPADRPRPLPVVAHVRTVEPIGPSMIRIVAAGTDLVDPARFGDPLAADAYVKLMFLHPDGGYAEPIDPNRIRAEMAPEFWPRLRTYTVRAFDRTRGEITLDIVVHGDAGLAGPWARGATVGDRVLLLGPGGDYSPRPAADWHLIAGDESALPAIAVALERLAASGSRVPISAFVEVHDAADEIELTAPHSAQLTWLHRGGRPVGDLLVDAVRAWQQPHGTGQAFVHGEAGAVKFLRRHLRLDRGLPLQQLSISGYWRTGVDDEGWREIKRDWNREVEESEQAAGVA